MPAAELERAKKAAISSVLMNLESRAVVAEDIGRQVLTYGHRCAAWLSWHRFNQGGMWRGRSACMAEVCICSCARWLGLGLPCPALRP